MKSRKRDEIRAMLGWNLLTQMKLNPSLSPDEVGFHHEVISSHWGGIYPVCKDGFSWKETTFVW